MAEWSIAAVLKTVEVKASRGSNPCLSAKSAKNQASGPDFFLSGVTSKWGWGQNYCTSEIFPKVGELVGTGSPIMTIVDLNDIWVTFNVREDLLSKINMGNILTAKVPALGNKEVKLRVTYIKVLGSYATWKATKLTDEYDTKTFEVKAVPVDKVNGFRPGMSVIVNWTKLQK